ncbi:MAG: hypothetical protein AOA66_0656 [Candidatus Bathyarchaeota archaeon BA2]|nr:MAG: hypothetical protein AOA66_0656 [Candidatus Bathyarchaeota archaeon BA2]
MDAENIRVDVWNGSDWENVFTDLNPGWNNVSVSSYLTSSNFTIRFKGGNETGDTTQSSWNIDATLLHVWTEYYEYVLNITNLSSSTDYQAKLEITSTNGISRLTNFTAYLHDGTTSKQVEISNGEITKSMGSWYSITTSTTIYLSLTIKVSASGSSTVDLRLHVVKSGTTSPEATQTVTINLT